MTNQDRNEIKNFVKAVRVEHDVRIAEKYVAQENGMSLCSDTEITRLASMETGAQVNKIEAISIDGVMQDIDTATKVISINLSEYAKKSEVSGYLKYKGSKDTFAQLPTTDNENGDTWNIKIAGGTDRHGVPIKAGDNVTYVIDEKNPAETGWDVQGGTTDLSGYVEIVSGKSLVADSLISALQTLNDESTETFVASDITDIFSDT